MKTEERREIQMDCGVDDSKVFNDRCIPDLLRYVVPIVWNPLNLGSGVLVRVNGRHFVASAAHCIRERPHALVFNAQVNLSQHVETREVRILQAGWHDRLDIGYLEIEDPRTPELEWNQLSSGRIVGGFVHVIGFPSALLQLDLNRREASLAQGTFSTSLIEETDEHLKFNYPRKGSRYDPASEDWLPSEFPSTPKGFSGGGCFGVTMEAIGGIEVVRYFLIGIQSCWLSSGRYIKAIPIKQWRDLLVARGLSE
jgi:hypothetical protein